MAVGQTQWYHFGVGAPPILVKFGNWPSVKAFESLARLEGL